MSHSSGLNFLLVFRDAGSKCPVDNHYLDELQVIIVGVMYQYKLYALSNFVVSSSLIGSLSWSN